MRIGIIAFGYIPAQTGGTETYFNSLIKGLQKYDKKNYYTLVVNKKYLKEASSLVNSKRWEVLGLRDIPPFHIRGLRKLKLIRKSNEKILEDSINSLNFDLIHFPFQVTYPFGIRTKKVLTFMDMQQQHFPEYFSKAELQYRKNNFKKSVEDSDAVIAISEFTASDIKKYYGKNNASKVKVIHIARPNQPKIAETNATFARYRPYFIYPAATWPHKNHERLIKAFRDVATKHPEYKLLLTGMDRQKTNDIKELISKLGLENNIYVLGYLPYGAMPSLYEQSFGLVFPSLFEGFGIPLLEAMSYKKPIASSDSSSLPEVGGKAAIYFNPIDTNSMSASMVKLIEDDALRKRLLIESKKQLSRFSLLGMINKTLEVYNKLTDEE